MASRKFLTPPPAKRWGGVGGGGCHRQTLCQRSELTDPPPPTPPRHAQGAWGGGEFKSRARSSGTTNSISDSIFQTTDIRPHSRGTMLPELCVSLSLQRKREQGMPDARCTRGLVCKDVRKKTHTSIQVQRRHSGIPCAMALRLISRSPRRIGLCCLRRLRIAGSSAPGRADLPSADLTPTVRRQDHTTSPYASAPLVSTSQGSLTSPKSPPCHPIARTMPPRPPHPVPTFVTMANAPSLGTGCRESIKVICPTAKAKICPSGYFVAAGAVIAA